MAKRVNDGVQPIKRPTGMDRSEARPKPTKATRSMSDREKSKRRLPGKTVAFSALLTL
jgi:hypothetical protein